MWERFIGEKVEEIRETVGDGRAVIALSGGVDSSVAAVLAHRAIGDRLHAVFVNTGFLRKGEPEFVRKTFGEEFGLNLHYIDASERFFGELRGVTDPEEKRKVIGRVFIEVFEEVAGEIDAEFLIQGTIAPDWIESRGKIKSHHNVGGLPERLNLKLIEPLRDLYKDEVRELGRELGLPEKIYSRMPFPGPGLAVRVLGEVTPERIAIVREANAIVEEEIEKAKLKPWQAFAVLLGVKTVGVQGDIRAYKETVAVRVVESLDGMTASAMAVPFDVLQRIAFRITSEIPEVGRVLYDVTNKPPATIEFE
ncbi:glutamine-hydrolyzing GMP synthase [Thermococcus celer]|uniref:GMP synthase [glutamine-hydrolyzing] subunit B n=1 Tax=Thermococcus celer Vu 13 = JCM 8558 TaxID=1293037 RepID=A0A218P075_THECE|nr:glutamine-hydrolyzing GMP synthase [Thermococcus celer]ASI98338.1 GMP synthase [Thermococcus celer] [Thermococcus celer Vu 13 = JCM 8558]